MNGPQRLVESDTSDLGTKMLRAAQAQVPTKKSLHRAMAAVALASSATAVAGTTAAAGAGATSLWIPVLKWFGVGVIAGGTVLAGRGAIRSVSAPTPPAAAVAQPTRGKAAEVVPVQMPATSTEPAPEDSAAPPPVRSPAVHASESIPQPSASTTASAGLADELRLIDEARAAVSRGNANQARDALDRYAAAFPRGRFGPEAFMLRIEALELQGDHAGAKRLAEQFIAANPNSPLVQRVKSLVGL